MLKATVSTFGSAAPTSTTATTSQMDQQHLRKCFSSVDNLTATDNEDDLRLLRRYNDLCSGDEADLRRRSFSGKLEILSTPKNEKRKSPPDNIILSKTVRKEKRKQRHKREMSIDRWTCDEDETSSPTSPSASKASRVTYMTSRFRDLTVKTPMETVAPSDEMIRNRALLSNQSESPLNVFHLPLYSFLLSYLSLIRAKIN